MTHALVSWMKVSALIPGRDPLEILGGIAVKRAGHFARGPPPATSVLSLASGSGVIQVSILRYLWMTDNRAMRLVAGNAHKSNNFYPVPTTEWEFSKIARTQVSGHFQKSKFRTHPVAIKNFTMMTTTSNMKEHIRSSQIKAFACKFLK